MSDELQELVEDATQVVDDAHQPSDSATGSGLRAQLEAAQSELREFKDKALDEAFAQNGLSRETGMGKAVAQLYDGDPTAEALEAHLVAEYGYVGEPDVHPWSNTINTEQSKLDQMTGHAGSIPVPTQADALQAAEARGDYRETLAVKAEQMGEWFRGRQA